MSEYTPQNRRTLHAVNLEEDDMHGTQEKRESEQFGQGMHPIDYALWWGREAARETARKLQETAGKYFADDAEHPSSTEHSAVVSSGFVRPARSGKNTDSRWQHARTPDYVPETVVTEEKQASGNTGHDRARQSEESDLPNYYKYIQSTTPKYYVDEVTGERYDEWGNTISQKAYIENRKQHKGKNSRVPQSVKEDMQKRLGSSPDFRTEYNLGKIYGNAVDSVEAWITQSGSVSPEEAREYAELLVQEHIAGLQDVERNTERKFSAIAGHDPARLFMPEYEDITERFKQLDSQEYIGMDELRAVGDKTKDVLRFTSPTGVAELLSTPHGREAAQEWLSTLFSDENDEPLRRQLDAYKREQAPRTNDHRKVLPGVSLGAVRKTSGAMLEAAKDLPAKAIGMAVAPASPPAALVIEKGINGTRTYLNEKERLQNIRFRELDDKFIKESGVAATEEELRAMLEKTKEEVAARAALKVFQDVLWDVDTFRVTRPKLP